MKDVKHTPAPFIVVPDGPHGFQIRGGCANPADTVVVAQVAGLATNHFAVADANFIVRACNAHDAMVKALAIAHRAILGTGRNASPQIYFTDKEREQIANALVLAQGAARE